MRLFFWQKKSAAQQMPDPALVGYPFLWRIADFKCFKRGANGLFVAEDGEWLNLYLTQQISQGEVEGYIFSQSGEHFPFGMQYFPKMPMPKQQQLLERLMQVEEAQKEQS